MKYLALLLLVTLATGCRDNLDPWEFVSAQEERQFFMECVRLAPPGRDSVRSCDTAAESWVLTTGLERKRAAAEAKP